MSPSSLNKSIINISPRNSFYPAQKRHEYLYSSDEICGIRIRKWLTWVIVACMGTNVNPVQSHIFFSLSVFDGTKVLIVYIFLCRPSEDSLQWSAIPDGSPSKDWQSTVGWGDCWITPRTGVSQSGVATNEPPLLRWTITYGWSPPYPARVVNILFVPIPYFTQPHLLNACTSVFLAKDDNHHIIFWCPEYYSKLHTVLSHCSHERQFNYYICLYDC